MPLSNPHQQPIRSFVRRQGRMTPAQQLALAQHWSRFGINITDQLIDFNALFGRNVDLTLEIGFGMGDSLLAMAKAHPHKDYIGIEVHTPGVGALLSLLAKEALDNIRIYRHDAINILNQCIADNSLSEVNIFFPDPWPKKRHQKRRLIQPAVIALIHRKLKAEGRIHLATDWESYAHQMMAVMSTARGFYNTAAEGQFIENQTVRPMTKFEKRGRRLGHRVWDLIFIKK